MWTAWRTFKISRQCVRQVLYVTPVLLDQHCSCAKRTRTTPTPSGGVTADRASQELYRVDRIRVSSQDCPIRRAVRDRFYHQ